MSLTSQGSQYNCRGHDIYSTDNILIARMVFECPKCQYLSKTIADSDHHFAAKHRYPLATQLIGRQLSADKLGPKHTHLLKKIESAVQSTKRSPKVLPNVTKKVETIVEVKPVVQQTSGSHPVMATPKARPITTHIEAVIDETIITDIYVNDFKNFGETQRLDSLKTYSKRKPIGVDVKPPVGASNTDVITADDQTIDSEGNNGIIIGKLFKCQYCGQQFNSVGLSRHILIHTAPHICGYTFCDQKFATSRQLSDHVFEAHERHKRRPPPGYQCRHCDRKYVNERDLRNHEEIHTNPKSCDICCKMYSTSGLHRHMRTHSKEYKYRCIPCNKRFAYYSNLLSHKRLHTNPQVCDHNGCGKKFASKHTLKVHSAKHSTDRPYRCDFEGCTKRFKYKSFIPRHKRVSHLKIKPYLCGHCSQRFSSCLEVNRHIETRHTDKELKYGCSWPECGKQFAFQHLLNRHNELHTGIKPYVCDYGDCDKNFATIYLMQIHKRIHSVNQKTKCELCSALLASKQSMFQHMKAVHNVVRQRCRTRNAKNSIEIDKEEADEQVIE